MRIRLHKSMKPILALLCVAGLLAGASLAEAQAATPKRSSSKSGASLHRTKSSRKSHRRERGQKVPAPDRISEIQRALAKDGSFTGTPNGKWDAATAEATKKFQESHGLNPTGKLDAKTLQQLGLGSQTAGAAPPLPPVSSTATIAPAPTARRQQ
jgi:peptidoglycan hydrolase-like protein with peptidoglycan-binding domain